MTIYGEIEQGENGYEGHSDDGQWFIHLDMGVLPEAYHILTMRGISRSQQSRILFDAETWLNDPTLRGLEGVEITSADEIKDEGK